MSTVLYEAPTGYGTIVAALILPFIVFLGFVIIPRLKYDPVKTFKGKNSSAVIQAPNYKLIIFVGIFMSVGMVLILQNLLEMHRKVIIPYANGQYEIVEGYVHNFIPMPPEGHSHEMFDIGDIHFEYSDNLVSVGYNKAKTNGGVIRGNGQYLKVGYVYYNESYGNIIVYIEELTEEHESPNR